MSFSQWMALLTQIHQAGQRGFELLGKIKAMASEAGFDVNLEMDKVIANATRREALARKEASGGD